MKTKNSKIAKRQNTYNSRGITLIALVVTIIVLIILAGVSINLVLGDNGIITKAKQAKTETEQAKLNEEIAMNELMEQWEDIAGGNGGTTTPTITINDLKAGDYIKYNTGVASVGENGVITCRVLYDASSEYGLQIISDKNVADVTLGGSDWATASASYNSAIETLNNEAEKYINATYVTDARCVGSVPTIDANGTFIGKNTENAGPVTLQFTSSVSGANSMKEADTNYTSNGKEGIVRDKETMESLGIWTTGESYWLASRYVISGSSNCYFRVRGVDTSGDVYRSYFCILSGGGIPHGYSYSIGLRPCFSLKSDITITGGDGKSETPYTM